LLEVAYLLGPQHSREARGEAVDESNWRIFFMLLTIFMMVMFALVVFVMAGFAVDSGYRAFDLLSKGEIAKGLFQAFSAFLFGFGTIRASNSNILNFGSAANFAASPFSIGPTACTVWSCQVKFIAPAEVKAATKKAAPNTIRFNRA
jgi:hypothetical protein